VTVETFDCHVAPGSTVRLLVFPALNTAARVLSVELHRNTTRLEIQFQRMVVDSLGPFLAQRTWNPALIDKTIRRRARLQITRNGDLVTLELRISEYNDSVQLTWTDLQWFFERPDGLH
jgi:hypothetical protein